MLKSPNQVSPSKANSFENYWPHIQPIVAKLISSEPIDKAEWQNLFFDVHMICSWDTKGHFKLLRELEAEVKKNIFPHFSARLASIQDGLQHLREYLLCWLDYSRHCERFPVAFQQLDLATKSIIPLSSTWDSSQINFHRHLSDSTVRTVFLMLWKKFLSTVNHRLVESVKLMLLDERNGLSIDSQLIVTLRESYSYLVDINFTNHQTNFLQLFEDMYVDEIEIYYSSRANDYMYEHGTIDYVRWALSKIDKEEQRSELYLEKNSKAKAKVSASCVKLLITNFVDQVIDECSEHIKANESVIIGQIFRFVDKVEGLGEIFLATLSDHIVSTSLANLMISDQVAMQTDCENFVGKLIETCDKFETLIKVSLNDDVRAKEMLDRAFEVVVNDTRIFQPKIDIQHIGQHFEKKIPLDSRYAEILAIYCDQLLRRTPVSRKFNQEEILQRLTKIVQFVKYLKNKDGFVKFYRLYLAKRLILNLTTSRESEEHFISKLKELSGISLELINKPMRMFSDLKQSQELQIEYMQTIQPLYADEESIINNNNNNAVNNCTSRMAANLSLQDNNNKASKDNKNCDLVNIRILNPQAWTDKSDTLAIRLPKEIMSVLPSYEAFYQDRYPGRKLDWSHQLSNGTLTFNGNKGKFELDVNSAQLAVLSAFSSPDECDSAKSLCDIQTASGLAINDLKRTLWVSVRC